MFSDNVQYRIKEPQKLLPVMNEGKQLLKEMFTSKELSAFVGRKLITTLLDGNDNIVKTHKLVGRHYGGGYRLGRT